MTFHAIPKIEAIDQPVCMIVVLRINSPVFFLCFFLPSLKLIIVLLSNSHVLYRFVCMEPLMFCVLCTFIICVCDCFRRPCSA